MPSAVGFIQWENYAGQTTGPRFFDSNPLTFSSQQVRLHSIQPGERLWLVSRCPLDQQYYFVGVLFVAGLKTNERSSVEAGLFGEFAIVADRSRSHDLGTSLPAEGILRALQFQSKKPIKHGASIGQSLQAVRFLSPNDERIMEAASARILAGEDRFVDEPFGLWTKCAAVFADYFLTNWTSRREPLAFLLYDPPPALRDGAPVFINSDRKLRLVAKFRKGLYLAGHKQTIDPDERIASREWVWATYRASTIDPPTKRDFESFWDSQNGVRGLFLMDDVVQLPCCSAFGEYGRALEWGFPTAVGYRYLSFSQSYLLLTCSGLQEEAVVQFLEVFLRRPS